MRLDRISLVKIETKKDGVFNTLQFIVYTKGYKSKSLSLYSPNANHYGLKVVDIEKDITSPIEMVISLIHRIKHGEMILLETESGLKLIKNISVTHFKKSLFIKMNRWEVNINAEDYEEPEL